MLLVEVSQRLIPAAPGVHVHGEVANVRIGQRHGRRGEGVLCGHAQLSLLRGSDRKVDGCVTGSDFDGEHWLEAARSVRLDEINVGDDSSEETVRNLAGLSDVSDRSAHRFVEVIFKYGDA